MKKTVLALLCLISTTSFAASYKGYADIPGDAKGFATQVIEYSPGTDVSVDRQVPELVTGPPIFYEENEAPFSLGKNGSLIMGFGANAIQKNGTSEGELYIYEVGTYESWDAYVSSDGKTWHKATPTFEKFPSVPTKGGSVIGYDLDLIDSAEDTFSFVKIVDTSTFVQPTTAGPDLDGIVITSAKNLGHKVNVDTDSLDGTVYDLHQNNITGAVGVDIIKEDGNVSTVSFSLDNSLKAIALSLQGNFNCDYEKDINVLATRTEDNVQVNIIKQQDGTDIKTIVRD